MVKRVNPFFIFFLLLMLLPTSAPAAEFVLIVNKENPINTISKSECKKIFLGKKSFWATGQKIDIILQEGGDVHSSFVYEVLNKSPRQLRMYWKQVLFSGAGTPPKILSDTQSLKELITSNPYAIGYIGINHLDDSVKKIPIN